MKYFDKNIKFDSNLNFIGKRFWYNSWFCLSNFKSINMKTLKLILASLVISFSVNAQAVRDTKHETEKRRTPDERAKFQTEKMKNQLSLTNEQYEKAYQINLGIIQKNQALQEQKMTTEERRIAVKQNNEARMAMFKNVLTAEQFLKMQEKVKEKKSTNKD
jgi:outer membrane PBP1 activator LpoA protein